MARIEGWPRYKSAMAMLPPSSGSRVIIRLARFCVDLSSAVLVAALVSPDIVGLLMLCNKLLLELPAQNAVLAN